MDFRSLNFFNGLNGQEGQTASLCQISSKSLERGRDMVIFRFCKITAMFINFIKFNINCELWNGLVMVVLQRS